MTTTPKVRWAVSFIDGDGKDDFQLVQNTHTKYFEDETTAKEFMETKRIKGMPDYWQPSIWKERELTFEYPRWIKE